MSVKIGQWVAREFGHSPDDPEEGLRVDWDERETDWHYVESVIAGAAITTCGRRMEPRLEGRPNRLIVSDVAPLTRMIGQPQLCQAGCEARA